MLYSATYLSGPLEAPRKPVRWNSQAEVEEVLQTIRRPPQPPHGSVGTPSDAPVIDSGGGASPATGGAATPQSVTLQPPPPPPPQQQALASKTAASTLDGSLDAALKLAAPGGPGFLLVTFSNAALKDHLLNFVAHLRDAGAAYLIGAVDVETFELLKELSPVYKTPLALSGFALDGSNQHSSGSWKRFAGMRSGEVTRIVSMGYSVLHTDTDVVWLRNPMPYLMCTPAAAQGEFSPASRFPCEAILKADVAVSSDNMSPGRDTEAHAGYSAGGTFNTGILFFRGNAQGQLFAKTWSDNVNSPARGTRFAGDTSDQQVFNHMHRDPKYWPGIKGVQGEHTMRTYYEEEGHVAARQGFRLGALPMALFQNGHGYFVASTHRRLGVAPMAVHATYSLDRHDGVAKRQRFRETGLWRSDPPSYYEGRFLAFNSTVSPRLQRAIDGFAASRKSANNIGIHAKALREHVAELRDALALARALKRTLVLPRWTCYCDRLWSPSDDIFHFGCMYPGAQDGDFLPFTCPMDHVLSPTDWEGAGVSYRDAAFLESSQMQTRAATAAAGGATGAATGTAAVRVLTRAEYDGLDAAAKGAALPTGVTTNQAKELLAAHAAAPVLRLSHVRGLLCGIDDDAEREAFARLAGSLLRVPAWGAKCFQPCASELAQWLSADEISAGGGGRGNFFTLHLKPPPAFRAGACVPNMEEP